MTEVNDSDSEVADDPYLSDWEISCLEDWDKTFVLDERRIQAETEKSSHRLWASFQNSASSVSQLYKDGLQSDDISLWAPFQSAAAHVTSLFKDSQELIRKSFELGNQMGHHRRNKELISWIRKRKRTLPREEIVAFICEKPAPAIRLKPYGRGASARRSVDITSSKFLVSSPAPRDYSADSDYQPFREALALQGLNGAMASASITRRSLTNSSQPILVGLSQANERFSANERLASFMTDELACSLSSRKRVKSGGDFNTPDSPSHKRTKVCGMETEEL